MESRNCKQKAKPGSTKPNLLPSNKVQLSKNRDTHVTNSRLARMWASQWKTKPQPILAVVTRARGLKRKLFNPVGGVEKAGRMGTICVCPCLCPAE